MPDDAQLYELSTRVGRRLLASKRRLAVAESCTGGWIAKVITDVPDSSSWFECGFVTYSNAAKMRDLGVSRATLDAHGAVSEATVLEMARGALRVSGADIAVSVSGIAGPNGGVPGNLWARCGLPALTAVAMTLWWTPAASSSSVIARPYGGNPWSTR